MTAKNDVTGNLIISKPSTVLYREGWERIFNEKKNSEMTAVPFTLEFSEMTADQINDAKINEESE